jgi:hypothetical protein
MELSVGERRAVFLVLFFFLFHFFLIVYCWGRLTTTTGL